MPPQRVFGPYRGWAPALLPHLGEKSLAAKYQMDKDFFDPANREAVGTRLPVRLQDNKNTAMIDETIRPLTEIVDGTSWTLLLSEQAGRPEHWVRGEKQNDRGQRGERFSRRAD